jgi:branched-chain amino acid transport system substrate-binding protein
VKIIVSAKPDLFYLPIQYRPPPLPKLRALRWKGTFLGWPDLDDAAKLGPYWEVLKGTYFPSVFLASVSTGAAKEFVDSLKRRYDYTPTRQNALAWDGMNILLQAIRNTGGLTGDVKKDRKAVRDQLALIKEFPGITGMVWYDGKTGDPLRCINIVNITGLEKYELVRTVRP